jgi:hypothetical protein
MNSLPDAALDADIAIMGRKGGGKSYTAKGIVERLLDMGRRVLILDPLGVWAGLRTAADGETAGYPVAIFGGLHADLPLDVAAAPALAGIVANNNLPAVIDLSELSKHAQQSFLYSFLGELRRVNREALTVVLEEADVFAPQNPQGDDSKALHSEIDWIARRGRFRGFRLITITQRPARLSKDVLTQCATLIAHRLPAPQDRDAIKAWVDGNGDRDQAKEVFDTLAGMAVGEGWVWSPENDLLERMRFPRIKTLDTSSTPKAGEKRIEPKTLAQVDLSGIKAALAAAADQETPRGQTSGKKSEKVASSNDVKEAEARGYARGRADGVAEVRELIGDRVGIVIDAMNLFREEFAEEDRATSSPPAVVHINAGPDAAEKVAEQMSRRVTQRPQALVAYHHGAMPTVAAKIVDAIDMKPARAFTWTQIAMLAGYSESGGQFRRGKKWLIENGVVIDKGGRAMIAKPSGRAVAPTGAALVEFWKAKLPSVGAAILCHLWQVSGRSSTSTSLANVADALNYAPSGGQFRRGVKALRDAQIAATNGGSIYLTAEFTNLMAG